MKLTNEIIREAMSSNGGWNKRQLEIIGINWPPQKGWKSNVIGKEYSKEIITEFLSLKK